MSSITLLEVFFSLVFVHLGSFRFIFGTGYQVDGCMG